MLWFCVVNVESLLVIMKIMLNGCVGCNVLSLVWFVLLSWCLRLGWCRYWVWLVVVLCMFNVVKFVCLSVDDNVVLLSGKCMVLCVWVCVMLNVSMVLVVWLLFV